jgi:hypothetical protein
VFEGGQDGRFSRACLILRHLCLVEEALPDRSLGESVFRVLPRPGKEVGVAFPESVNWGFEQQVA